jgi:hypothetical protein
MAQQLDISQILAALGMRTQHLHFGSTLIVLQPKSSPMARRKPLHRNSSPRRDMHQEQSQVNRQVHHRRVVATCLNHPTPVASTSAPYGQSTAARSALLTRSRKPRASPQIGASLPMIHDHRHQRRVTIHA